MSHAKPQARPCLVHILRPASCIILPGMGGLRNCQQPRAGWLPASARWPASKRNSAGEVCVRTRRPASQPASPRPRTNGSGIVHTHAAALGHTSRDWACSILVTRPPRRVCGRPMVDPTSPFGKPPGRRRATDKSPPAEAALTLPRQPSPAVAAPCMPRVRRHVLRSACAMGDA